MKDVKVKEWLVVSFAVLRVVRFVRELGRGATRKAQSGVETRRNPNNTT